jgi:ABC-type multidrug transport system ATPase subunit
MGHIDVSGVEYSLSDGRVLLNDVSFRVGDGAKVALIGPNGSGKTTLVRMICGDISPDEGQVAITGGLGVMRQFIGSAMKPQCDSYFSQLLQRIFAMQPRKCWQQRLQ